MNKHISQAVSVIVALAVTFSPSVLLAAPEAPSPCADARVTLALTAPTFASSGARVSVHILYTGQYEDAMVHTTSDNTGVISSGQGLQTYNLTRTFDMPLMFGLYLYTVNAYHFTSNNVQVIECSRSKVIFMFALFLPVSFK